jgi:solute carrier family 35, member F1/2
MYVPFSLFLVTYF